MVMVVTVAIALVQCDLVREAVVLKAVRLSDGATKLTFTFADSVVVTNAVSFTENAQCSLLEDFHAYSNRLAHWRVFMPITLALDTSTLCLISESGYIWTKPTAERNTR